VIKDIAKQFGENVRAKRKAQSLSQEDLALRAELHRTYIGMIERGEKNITLSNINRISSALNVNIKDLMEFKDGK
jgi:transcriptional regulator with XRE-family HTH domain